MSIRTCCRKALRSEGDVVPAKDVRARVIEVCPLYTPVRCQESNDHTVDPSILGHDRRAKSSRYTDRRGSNRAGFCRHSQRLRTAKPSFTHAVGPILDHRRQRLNRQIQCGSSVASTGARDTDQLVTDQSDTQIMEGGGPGDFQRLELFRNSAGIPNGLAQRYNDVNGPR